MPSGFEIEGRKIIYIIFNSAQSNTSEKPQLKLAICRRHVIAWKRSRITRAYCYRFIIDVRVDEWVTSCRSKLDFPLPTVRANSSHFCSYDRMHYALSWGSDDRRPVERIIKLWDIRRAWHAGKICGKNGNRGTPWFSGNWTLYAGWTMTFTSAKPGPGFSYSIRDKCIS